MKKNLITYLAATTLLALGTIPVQSYLVADPVIVSAQEVHDFDALRETLLQDTPLTQEQADLLTDDQLQATSERLLREVPTGGDIGVFYNFLIKDYPDVFEETIQNLRNLLVETGMTKEEADSIDEIELIWADRQVIFNNGASDGPAMVKYLQDIGVIKENQPIAIEDVYKSLLESAPISQEQLDQIPDEDLLAISEEVNQTGGDPATVFNKILEAYPKVFEAEVNRIKEELAALKTIDPESLEKLDAEITLWINYLVKLKQGAEDFPALSERLIQDHHVKPISTDRTPEEEAADIRRTLLESTPITESQLAQFTDQTLLDTAKLINDAGGDPGDAYNHLVKTFPKVFQGEVDRLQKILVQQYGLDQARLEQLLNVVVLWENYLIQLENKGQENFAQLAEKLVTKHNIPRHQGQDQTTTTESKKPVLPQTGEKFIWHNVVGGLGLLAIGSVLLKKK